jgi:hypothetical protein
LALDQALSIFTMSPESVPLDRIKLLHVRAAVYARRGNWQRAGEAMEKAISLADHDASLDSEIRKSLLDDYAKLLRNNRQGRQARSIEARAAAVRTSSVSNSLVDVTELVSRPKAVR